MNSAVDGLVEDLSYHSHGVLREFLQDALGVMLGYSEESEG
jgi:hypothetical protein